MRTRLSSRGRNSSTLPDRVLKSCSAMNLTLVKCGIFDCREVRERGSNGGFENTFRWRSFWGACSTSWLQQTEGKLRYSAGTGIGASLDGCHYECPILGARNLLFADSGKKQISHPPRRVRDDTR